jgi:ankyrin repeat protein
MGGSTSKEKDPIETAIEKDDIDTVSDLIENGFDVNTIITEGKTPLILAAAQGRIKIAELLIEKNANVHVTFDNNQSALSEALYKLTSSAALYNLTSSDHEDLEMVRLLIDKGVKANNVFVKKFCAGEVVPCEIFSIYIRSPGLLELLIKGDADVNAKDNSGNTALSLAKGSCYATKITKLLEEAAEAQLAHSAPVGADGGTSESEGYVEIRGEVMKDGDA